MASLEKSLALNQPRALVHMATGASKTFTAITSVYRLLKFGGAKRVLFLVDHAQGVALAQRQAGRQARPVIRLPRDHVLIELGWSEPGGDQRVALQVSDLGAICLRYPHAANQEALPVTYTFDKVTV